VQGKLLLAMYVLKAKPKICAPHSSKTDEPRNTKIGMEHLGPTLIPCAKIGYDHFTGARAPEPPFHVDFGFFLFFSFYFFSCFFDQATDRTAEPILMVDGSNDVFSRKEVPFGGHIIT
jgi:hypothetical protein